MAPTRCFEVQRSRVLLTLPVFHRRHFGTAAGSRLWTAQDRRVAYGTVFGHGSRFRQTQNKHGVSEVQKDRDMDIYVGNLAYSTNDESLRSAFAAYGEVASARVVSDRMTGRSKGFGFVEMPDRTQAQAAIDGLNGQDLDGRTLRVNESQPKPREERRGGFGGGAGGGFRGGRGGGGGRGGDRRESRETRW